MEYTIRLEGRRNGFVMDDLRGCIKLFQRYKTADTYGRLSFGPYKKCAAAIQIQTVTYKIEPVPEAANET